MTGEIDGWQTGEIVSFHYWDISEGVEIVLDFSYPMIQSTNSGIVKFGEGPFANINLNAGNRMPTQYLMMPNYPNPFNPSTLIRYELPEQSRVELMIYNISGQKVATLVDGIQPAGFHHISWKGQNTFGQEVASGMYFCVMMAKALDSEKSYGKTNKLLLIK